MIPSCNVCNSKSKGNKDKRHLNPYKDENTNLRFSVSFDKIEDLYNFSEEDIQVKISPNNQTALNSIDVFNLDKIYEIHNDVVFELKNKIIASIAFKNASDYYNMILGEALFDAPDWSSTWFDFLNKDPLKEPLVKLKQDIYYQIMSSIKK